MKNPNGTQVWKCDRELPVLAPTGIVALAYGASSKEPVRRKRQEAPDLHIPTPTSLGNSHCSLPDVKQENSENSLLLRHTASKWRREIQTKLFDSKADAQAIALVFKD